MHVTEKHYFHGERIYPKMLLEPARDVEMMEQSEWVDLQTEYIALSTMVYTEDLEIFTSLTVTFAVDEAGNVDGTYDLVSYTDMINESKDKFIYYSLACNIGGFIGVVLSLIYLVRNPSECKWGLQAFEFFSRLALLVYPLVLQISWQQQVPMTEEYDHLLHTFLDLESTSHEDIEGAIQAYFDVKTHIYYETNWLKRHRICAYIVIYIQFLQLIFYFNAHPRMALITSTVNKAMSDLMHFALLFCVLFVMLGFASHWMLGEYIEGLGTFEDTMNSQVRKIFGEFIFHDGAEDLNATMTVMYWLYAFTFGMTMFFTLLNFFLAIIIDAFAEVKSDIELVWLTEQSFPMDVYSIIKTQSTSVIQRWPPKKALIKALQAKVEPDTGKKGWLDGLPTPDPEEKKEVNKNGKVVMGVDAILEVVQHYRPGPDGERLLARILAHYSEIVPNLIRRTKPVQGEEDGLVRTYNIEADLVVQI
jgi:hypothetical protein